MKPYEYEGQGGTYYLFRSRRSGFPTRAFLNVEDAWAELRWLDRQWEDLRAFWTTRTVMRTEALNRRLGLLLANLCLDAGRGVPIQLRSPSSTDQPQQTAPDALEGWIGLTRDDCLNGLIGETAETGWNLVWAGIVRSTAELLAAQEEVNRKRVLPGGPFS